MDELRVELGERAYPIVVGPGLIDDAQRLRAAIPASAAVVTSERIAPLYLGRVTAALRSAGVSTMEIVLPDGEASKTAATLEAVYSAMLERRCDRKTTLVALGGGVVGDLTGFAAATYQRGVPYVQIPTTLLAQVDSSVGGKTAINHPLGKNMIGAFHQPILVLIDTATLATLPEREYRSGLAEVIKYGLIDDVEFLAWLEAHLDALLSRDTKSLTQAILRSCAIKARIVAADERESGMRAWLNLGHTFGHAIEAGLGYGEWLHGEAVAAGMVAAADLSARLGYISAADVERVVNLIARAGLPVAAPKLGRDRYLDLMRGDKKSEAGAIRYVLLTRLGVARVEPGADLIVTEPLAAVATA
ncbi:MAG: 3-dehydroquinate synthase [Burkholderiales bacterium]